ncbi:MAG: bactofilin family protein [Bacillota bacterium]
MFNSSKNEENKTQSKEIESIIGKGAKITGELVTSNSVRVEGKIDGSIESKSTLIIGKEALIKNKVKAKNITIAGQVEGEIIAHNKVELLQTAKVNADISTKSLKIEEGAVFNGSSKSLTEHKTAKINQKDKKQKTKSNNKNKK